MSLVKVAGNASGTGTITIQAPNTNTNYTLDLPAAAGTIQLSGNAISGTTGTFSGTISGGSTIGVGGATPANTGAGITFPATQSASSNANTLDDYEEGTWTPLWTRSSSNPTYSNETATGRYTKIGNLVTVSWYFLTSTISAGGSGAWYISNLPFSSANALPQNYASIGRVYNSAEVTGMRAFNPYNTSRIEYMTVATDATYTATANGYTILEGTMSYFV